MRHALIVSLALALLGCAHVDRRTRASRILLGTGAFTLVVGGVASAGCVHDTPEGCGGGPGDADLGVGIPLMLVGAALITAGALLKPRSPGPGKHPVPPPVQPDPFVAPLRGHY